MPWTYTYVGDRDGRSHVRGRSGLRPDLGRQSRRRQIAVDITADRDGADVHGWLRGDQRQVAAHTSAVHSLLPISSLTLQPAPSMS